MLGADGLTVDRQGRVIMATFAGRTVARIEANGARTVLADKFEVQASSADPTTSWSSATGGVYFTDTFGAFRQRENDTRREMLVMGVYRWKDGKVTKVIDDMSSVNGLAFSPDEKYLYVNASRENYGEPL